MSDSKKPEEGEEHAPHPPVDEEGEAPPEHEEAAAAPSRAASKEEPADDEGDDAKADGGQEDERAQRVADALGVGDESDAEKPEGAEPEAATNRAARRREEALKRRKKRPAAAEAASARAPNDDEEDLPRDRNKRAKELLARRREQAAAGPRPVQLLPSEMVDDALSRSASAAGKWIQAHFAFIQWALLALVAGGGIWLFVASQQEKAATKASEALASAVAADRGRVMAEDKRSDEEKQVDTTKIFKTADEKTTTALAKYRTVETEHAKSGAAILAKLGEAGMLLDKRDYDGALAAYSSVASSTLAAADPDVKGRANEGVGLAKEGKGDLEGAMSAFKEVQANSAPGYRELGMYHQGRILLAKGDKEAAKDLLKKVHDLLSAPGEVKLTALQTWTDDTLRQIDPALVPSRTPVGGSKGNSLSPEEAAMWAKKLQEAAQKKPHDHEGKK